MPTAEEEGEKMSSISHVLCLQEKAEHGRGGGVGVSKGRHLVGLQEVGGGGGVRPICFPAAKSKFVCVGNLKIYSLAQSYLEMAEFIQHFHFSP